MAIVLFDCDGVLVNTEEIAMRNARHCLGAAGLCYSDDDFSTRFDGADFATFRQHAKDDFLAATGQHLDEQFFDDMHTRYLAQEAAGIAAIVGIHDFVESLVRSKVPFAICSNSYTHNIERKLKTVGLYDFFAGRILGRDNVENGKPAPDVYLAGMALLGRTNPQECLVIEDSAVGAAAGHAAGMRVMGYTGGNAVPDQHATKLKAVGAIFTAPTMAAVALEVFEQVDMIDQAANWRNAPQRARRLSGPGPA